MKTGTVSLGPASVHIGYSGVIPGHLRGHLRELSSLVVDQAARGHGAAAELMRDVIAQADESHIALMVIVEPFDGCALSDAALCAWYARLGFVEIQNVPKVIMVRQAKRVCHD